MRGPPMPWIWIRRIRTKPESLTNLESEFSGFIGTEFQYVDRAWPRNQSLPRKSPRHLEDFEIGVEEYNIDREFHADHVNRRDIEE